MERSANGKLAIVKTLRDPLSDDQMFVRFPKRARTPDWFLRIEETSAFVYLVTASDRWGREVSRHGTEDELDRMVEECESYAASIRNSK